MTNQRWLSLLLLCGYLHAEPITLKHAVELALTHATGAAISAAEEQAAAAGVRELHNNYIPQLTAGAGLGWSDGFPLSLEGGAPSLFNLTAQSTLINPALKSFIRAARSESQAGTLRSKDQRNQIIQDTVLSYSELAMWEDRMGRLAETEAAARTTESVVAQRVHEGVDSELEGTKARLSTARVRLRIAEARGSADVLREHLSKLTGLAAPSIETLADSVPTLPAVKKEDDIPANSVDANPLVQAALDHARAQYLRAQAEHKSLWPSIDFAAQYALVSNTINNYQRFYQPGSFQQNNATIGLAIRFPFLNAAQRSRAEAADAEAMKAKKQAEEARNRVSEETLRLQRFVAQMQAAGDVAELEYEIAGKNFDATQTRMDAGSATLRDLADARTQTSERFIALQDMKLELERAQVGLLRSTGSLEQWALGPK